MSYLEISQHLKNYISQQILDGKDIGLTEDTPLLAWGVINSLEIVRIMHFIKQTFNIQIPSNQLTADNFTDLAAITNLIMKYSSKSDIEKL